MQREGVRGRITTEDTEGTEDAEGTGDCLNQDFQDSRILRMGLALGFPPARE